MDNLQLKRRATLEPPLKSIELEDPGAHDLEASENEEDVFSDAQEGHGSYSGNHSPIPITRVEKVDDHENYGEVPGTAAYEMRIQDAVPDELEIIPDGQESKRASKLRPQEKSPTAAALPIPKTVVQEVVPSSPSHKEVRGTPAHSLHKSDAVPDVVVQVTDPDVNPFSEAESEGITTRGPIQGTGTADLNTGLGTQQNMEEGGSNTRRRNEDHESSQEQSNMHDLPTRPLNRSRFTTAAKLGRVNEAVFPIAEDGGFGPMRDEMGEMSSVDADDTLHMSGKERGDNDQGEEFDEFEAGVGDDDFGDFDDGFQHPSSPADRTSDTHKVIRTEHVAFPFPSSFPLLDFSQLDSADDLDSATARYLDEIFPTTRAPPSPPVLPTPENHSIFLTDRSLSLWSQLVAPPPLQPPNWVRSRIRRLFLVSLGVPVDLDEILPASKQKKLVLPSTDVDRDSRSPSEGAYEGSRVKLKQDNASSASVDQPSSQKTNRRRKGPPPPPELDLGSTKMLCMTTEAALSNFQDSELQDHVRKLEDLTARASEVLEYWLKRKDNALGDKEAFEGVIENLVKHARRVRK